MVKAVRVMKSEAMGRAAVVWVILVWQAVPLAYLFGISGSGVITDVASGRTLPAVWSFAFVASAAFIGLMYRMKDDGAKNFAELGALGAFILAMIVFATALAATVTGADGYITIGCFLVGLIGAFVGRGAFLVRQLRFEHLRRIMEDTR